MTADHQSLCLLQAQQQIHVLYGRAGGPLAQIVEAGGHEDALRVARDADLHVVPARQRPGGQEAAFIRCFRKVNETLLIIGLIYFTDFIGIASSAIIISRNPVFFYDATGCIWRFDR